MRKSFLMESFYKKTLGCLILAFLLLLPLVKADTYLTDCAVLDTPGETYYLMQDIINYTSGNCMDIRADNIVLDCQGHTISTNITDYMGIISNGRQGLVVRNCVLTGWGIFEYNNSNITLQNLVISEGNIQLSYSQFNTLINVTIFSTEIGVNIGNSDYTYIFNSTVKGCFLDVYYSTTREEKYCHSYFENVNGTDDKPIVFFNSTAEIRDWNNNASEIILCGADNSIVDNLKLNKNGLFVIVSDNVSVTNSVFNSAYLEFSYSNNGTVYNTNIFSFSGLYLRYSNSFTISNLSVFSSSYGLRLFYANYNMVNNSRIENCTYYGVYLRNSANNLIYNNLFNNTNNIGFGGTIYTNNWNITRQIGARIYSAGTEIGGNYWTNPTGNGYSDTCTDADKDGFCDDPYVLVTDNVDYLALSDEYTPPTTTTTLPPVHGVPLLSSTLVGVVIGFGIITFMLRTLFDINAKEIISNPEGVVMKLIALAVIVTIAVSLIVLFA